MATLENFKSESQLTAAAATVINTNSSETKFIGKATFTNTSASAIEVTVWRLATATTATTGSGGNWLDKRTIQAGKVWECDRLLGHLLGNSMQVRAVAGTADVINADLSGVTEP